MMRRHIAAFLLMGWLGFSGLTCAGPLVIGEPFASLSTSLAFQPGALALPAPLRTKLTDFAHRLLRSYETPVHECDTGVFVFIGALGNGTPEQLKSQDDLFKTRVAYLRAILQRNGISKRVGFLILPSEVSRGLSAANADSVDIEVKHWIHSRNDLYPQEHVDCKWPPSAW